MRGYKVRLKFTPKQESLAWWYSKVSRNFWNLLVDIDRRNNFGEFDNILNISGNKLYYSNFYEREMFMILANQIILSLLKLLLISTLEGIKRGGLGIINLTSRLYMLFLLKNL